MLVIGVDGRFKERSARLGVYVAQLLEGPEGQTEALAPSGGQQTGGKVARQGSEQRLMVVAQDAKRVEQRGRNLAGKHRA